jgi:uncharacterized protein (UPF0147 family)
MTTSALTPAKTHLSTEAKWRAVARDIAVNINELDTILDENEVGTEEWLRMETSPVFQAMLREAIELWNQPYNVKERVELRAQHVLEASMLQAAELIRDRNEPAVARVKMIEVLAKLGKVGGADAGSGSDPGNRVSITINMGEDKKLHVEHDVTPVGNLIEGEVV